MITRGRLEMILLNPFKSVEPKPARARQAEARPEPTIRYAMHFTPRSGSSRLTDICKNAGNLGIPAEVFNKRLMIGIATAYGARNLKDFIYMTSRLHGTDGVFGFQITPAQLHVLFLTSRRFMRLVRPTHHFWLLREDIVLQAISISRMLQTSLSHSPYADAQAMIRAEDSFRYDGTDFANRVRSLTLMEQTTERFFRRFRLSPLCMTYEAMNVWGEARTARIVADHLGIAMQEGQEIHSDHKKVSGPKSNAFAERFRAENADLVAEVEARRAPRMAEFARQIDTLS